MALNFLDDVFSLHLAFETAQSILKGFAFLYTNFCQVKYTSNPARMAQVPAYSLQHPFDI
jgi:hypothetical protein